MPMCNLIILCTYGMLFYISEASRLCGNKDTASSQVSAGSALLGGSTAMLLTLLGGCCIIVGKCDLENLRAKPVEKNARGFSLVGTYLPSSLLRTLLVSCVKEYFVEQLFNWD